MGRRISQHLALVVPLAEDVITFHHHSANGNFLHIEGALRFHEGELHPLLVLRGVHVNLETGCAGVWLEGFPDSLNFSGKLLNPLHS